jgi:hypothetical protein
LEKCKIGAAVLGLLALLLALPACLDYEVKLKLEANGWGQVATRVVLPAGQGLGGMPEQLKTILEPKPQLQNQTAAGHQVLTETARFRALSQLKMRRLRFKVELKDIGLIYVGTPSYRFTAWLMPTGHDRRDRSVGLGHELDRRPTARAGGDELDRKVARLYARSLTGRHFSLTVELPGKITKARDWVVGSHRITPTVSAARTRETWRFPLAVLINQQARANLVFTADFKGRFATGASVASTTPGQVAPGKKKDRKGPSPSGVLPGSPPGGQHIGVTPRGTY